MAQRRLTLEDLEMHGDFVRRHIGPTSKQQKAMAKALGYDSLDDLIDDTVPGAIRNEQPFQRFFRDSHVITQHAFVCESRLEAVGQVRLGLNPDWGFFHI